MVEKVFILCCTYYQLLVAMQLKKTLLKECDITVALTDDSNGAKEIVRNMKKTDVFSDCIYLEKKAVSTISYYKRHRVVGLYKAIWTSHHLRRLIDKRYDRFLFYNLDLFTYWVYAALARFNKEISAELFEEGMIGYQNIPLYEEEDKKGIFSFVRLFRTILKKPNLLDSVIGFYGFNQHLYKGTWLFKKIPVFSGEDRGFKEQLSIVFDIDISTLRYPQKYIYFASLLSEEGGGEKNEEVYFSQKLAEIVGYDNLLIKVHPRGNRQEYIANGLAVDEHSSVPFEVIQLLLDFSGYVFVTAISGAPLTISSIQTTPPAIIYGYKLFSKVNEQWMEAYDTILETLRKERRLPRLWIPDTKEELDCLLDEISTASQVERKGVEQ